MLASISVRRPVLLGTGILAFAALALPGQALAGTGRVQGSELVYEASLGEANSVNVTETVSGSTHTFTITDVAGLTAGPGCSGTGTTLSCDVANATRVRLELGNLNDAANANVGVPVTAYGELGGDRLVGGSRSDLLDGGDGDDAIIGNDGRDRMLGGPGEDFFNGGDDADDIEAGTGDDTAFGGNGDDVMTGYLGDDRMTGEGDDDELDGGAGDDSLNGSSGRDTIDGEAGKDRITGGSGLDVLRGGRHADVLNAVDNAGGDRLDCGDGFLDGDDTAQFDQGDIVNVSCEIQQQIP